MSISSILLVQQSPVQVLFVIHYSKVAIIGVLNPIVLQQPVQVIIFFGCYAADQICTQHCLSAAGSFPCAFDDWEENVWIMKEMNHWDQTDECRATMWLLWRLLFFWLWVQKFCDCFLLYIERTHTHFQQPLTHTCTLNNDLHTVILPLSRRIITCFVDTKW